MKLWAVPCRAPQDGWVIEKSFDKTWFTGEGNGNLLQYSCLGNTLDSKKGQRDIIPEDEPPRSAGVQYATGEEWTAITNSSRKMKWLGQSRNYTQLWMSGGENLML